MPPFELRATPIWSEPPSLDRPRPLAAPPLYPAFDVPLFRWRAAQGSANLGRTESAAAKVIRATLSWLYPPYRILELTE
jgi:hypothetical protein